MNETQSLYYIPKYSLLLNFWSTMYKFMVPKLVDWIFYQLNKCDQQAPWMWSINDQSLQKNSDEIKHNITIPLTNLEFFQTKFQT